MNHDSGMKLLLWFAATGGFAVLLTGCGTSNSGGHVAGTGPFDSRGNYVEAWADNPAKWRKPGSAPAATASVAEIARNEQPPMNSNPLASSVVPVVKVKPVPKVDSLAPLVVKRKPQPREQARVVKTVVKPKVVSKPKPKVAVKVKPATKRYVVKSGDSLSAIASRNGISVSALQRANGIKGTIIRPGQALTIPK